jgi:hypothetical protein
MRMSGRGSAPQGDARLCVWARVADAASVAPGNSDFISLELRAF